MKEVQLLLIDHYKKMQNHSTLISLHVMKEEPLLNNKLFLNLREVQARNSKNAVG